MARRWWLLLGGIPAAVALWAAGAADSVPISIRLFGYDRSTGDVVLYADGPVESRGFPLREPDRWVVDIPNAIYKGTTTNLASVPGTRIRQIRIGQFTRSDVRVVFDLEEPMEVPVRTERRQLRSGHDFRLVFDLPDATPVREIRPAPQMETARAKPSPSPEPIKKVEHVGAGAAIHPVRKVPAPPEMHADGQTRPHAGGKGEAGRENPAAGTPSDGRESPPVDRQPPPGLAEGSEGPFSWLSGLAGLSGIFGGDRKDEGAKAAWPFTNLEASGGGPFEDPHAGETDTRGEEPKPVPVSGLTLRRAGKGWILRITADRPVDYRLARLGKKDRIYVDLKGGNVDIPRESMYVDNGLMARVRKGQTHDGTTRVVLELDQPLRYEAHQSADRQSVILALSRSEPRTIPGAYEDRITIDPGHGGNDPGTIGPAGSYEKNVTLAIASKVSSLLEKSGADVQMTRSKDVDLMLWPRVDMGDEFKSDAFVSIHMNSAPNRATQGIETYYFTPESIPLARSIHRRLVAQLGAPDRGIRRANFVVVKYARMPAVLVEVGYLSNPREEVLLNNAEYQQRAAEAIKVGIFDFLAARTLARR